MKYLFIPIIIFTTIYSENNKLPYWILKSPGDTTYFWGVGYSIKGNNSYIEATEKAQIAALKDLHNEIKAFIEERPLGCKDILLDKSKEEAILKMKYDIISNSNNASKEWEPLGTWYDSTNKKLWYCLRIQRDKFLANINNPIEENIKQIVSTLHNADTSTNIMTHLNTLYDAYELYNKFKGLTIKSENLNNGIVLPDAIDQRVKLAFSKINLLPVKNSYFFGDGSTKPYEAQVVFQWKDKPAEANLSVSCKNAKVSIKKFDNSKTREIFIENLQPGESDTITIKLNPGIIEKYLPTQKIKSPSTKVVLKRDIFSILPYDSGHVSIKSYHQMLKRGWITGNKSDKNALLISAKVSVKVPVEKIENKYLSSISINAILKNKKGETVIGPLFGTGKGQHRTPDLAEYQATFSAIENLLKEISNNL